MSTATVPRSKTKAYSRRYAKMHRNGIRLSVDSTVAVRMIRALQRIGYTREQIAAEAGVCDKRYVGKLASGARKTVYLATDRQLRAAYERLHMHPQDTTAAKRVITYATKRGWPAPWAWDDITSLNEQPKGMRK